MSSHPPMEKLEAGSKPGPLCDLARRAGRDAQPGPLGSAAYSTGVSKTLTNWLLVGR